MVAAMTDREETHQHILRVMVRHPELTTNGFGFGHLVRPADYEVEFQKRRRDMLSDGSCRQFEMAVTWLRLCSRTKRVNRGQTTYGLKHEAEAWARSYISNGMLIAAALHLGFTVAPASGSADDCPNAYINISTRHRPNFGQHCSIPAGSR
ncbi:MAG: hypothetical protein WCA81_18665 [Rhizomicrobium sp.]